MTLFVDPFFLIGLISLILGLIAGFVMHRSDFCLAGMFRDLFLFRRTVMLKSLFLLVVSSMVLFEAARRLGLLSEYPFPLLYSPSLANVIGGLLFGIGMVFAGACVVGTLYKMGSGSLLAFVCFAGLIVGSGLYAEIHPFWSAFAKKTTFFHGKITVSQILGIDPLISVLIIAVPGVILLYRWHMHGALKSPAFASGYIQPYKAALVLSVVGALSYSLLGMPMGVTSTYTKIAGFLERVLFIDHFETLTFYKSIPLQYHHALSGRILSGGPGPGYDALAAIQVPLIVGIIGGSAVSAALLKELRFYYRGVPVRQYILAGFGGVLMGIASRFAPTCNVWHLLGGLPILAASSILFLLGMLPGAWIGGKFLVRLLKTRPDPAVHVTA